MRHEMCPLGKIKPSKLAKSFGAIKENGLAACCSQRGFMLMSPHDAVYRETSEPGSPPVQVGPCQTQTSAPSGGRRPRQELQDLGVTAAAWRLPGMASKPSAGRLGIVLYCGPWRPLLRRLWFRAWINLGCPWALGLGQAWPCPDPVGTAASQWQGLLGLQSCVCPEQRTSAGLTDRGVKSNVSPQAGASQRAGAQACG